ncbi:hypothetical protein ACXWRS_10405, partial [Streptococcus pyogenes]
PQSNHASPSISPFFAFFLLSSPFFSPFSPPLFLFFAFLFFSPLFPFFPSLPFFLFPPFPFFPLLPFFSLFSSLLPSFFFPSSFLFSPL